jgi:hypothetical protein
MPVSSETALAVKALARQHQEAIWARQHTVNRLRSVLLEYYPNALDAFPNLTHRAALTILAAVPSPARAAKLTIKKTVTLLRRCGRGDRPGLAEQIVRDLTAATLRQPRAVEEALATATVGLVSVITAMETVIAELEVAMTTEFDRHRHAELLRSVPGLGPVLAARVLAEIGDDPNRFATASGLCAFAGTAPITRASGRTKTVNARHIRNRRLGDACHWWAFAALTKSPGARAHYDRRRAAGDGHNAALRNLANKLLSRVWWCPAFGCHVTRGRHRASDGRTSEPASQRRRAITVDLSRSLSAGGTHGGAVCASPRAPAERRSVCSFGAVVSGAYQPSPTNPGSPCSTEDEYATRRSSLASFGALSQCAERRLSRARGSEHFPAATGSECRRAGGLRR